MSSSSGRGSIRAQLSPAGIVIGVIGCVIITASSVYTALKMGALPWPTIFTSITALVLLRALGRRSLNEANITQVKKYNIMSPSPVPISASILHTIILTSNTIKWFAWF